MPHAPGPEAPAVVDPYDWLGLPKPHRPPTHYQLLDVPLSVAEPAAIRSAADRQFRRLLPHMTGPDALDAERVWSELEDARDTLLDPDRRAHYDASTPEPTPTNLSSGGRQPPGPARTGSVPDWVGTAVDRTGGLTPPARPGPIEAPLSPDELAAASEPDPDPWWKNAPPAAAGTDPWWKESVPDRPAPPPPPPPPAGRKASPSHASPSGRTAKPSHVHPKARKTPLLLVLAGGLVVAGAIGGGVFLAFDPKPATTPGDPSPAPEAAKDDPRPKPADPQTPKVDDRVVEVPLPKDFADQLRPKTFAGHAGAVNALAVAGSGSRFVSAGTDRALRFWSISRDDAVLRHTFTSPGVGVIWADHDRRLVAADGLTLGVFDATKTTPARPMDSPRGGVTALAATADGARAMTGLSDGYLRLWDTSAARSDEWPVAARGPVTALDVSSDGTLAVAAVADGPVSVWKLAGRNRVHEWHPHPGGAIAVRFSPDGARIATAGPDGSGSVFDLSNTREVCRLDGHAGPVTGIAWLPDGRQVVTVSLDGTARLWAAEAGQPLRWTQTLDGKGTCVAVEPGGRYVLAGTSTGAIHLYPLPRVKPEATAGPAGKPPAEPLPVPDAEAVATAIAGVRTELAREFALTRPDDVALLADNLRRRAAAANVVPPLRYGLLREAWTLAVKAGDAVTAFKAIEDLAAWFDVDELGEKAATCTALPPEADGPALVAVGLIAAERAETDPRPEVVNRILRRLPATPPAGVPADQVTRLSALRKRAAAATAEHRELLRALDVLKNAPDDPASNNTVGRFLCLTRQDWKAGLGPLARGGDVRLGEAARADLAGPTDAKAQHRVAELWYSLAIDTTDHRARRALLGRARVWLERELKAKLEVVDAVKARARLDDIGKLDVPGKDPLTLPLFMPAPVRRPYNTVAADVLRHEWKLDGGAAGREDGVALPAGSPTLTSRFGLAPGGKLTLAFRPDGREVRVTCGGQEFAFAAAGKSLRVTAERTEDRVTVTAVADDGEPVARTADLPATLRGPTHLSVRLTGTPTRDGGAVLTAAVARGAVSLPLPLPE